MLSPESEKLFTALRQYTLDAMALLGRACAESRPVGFTGLQRWENTGDGIFQLRPEPHWTSCLFALRDDLTSIGSYSAARAALLADARFKAHVDQLVGTREVAMMFDIDSALVGLVAAMARQLGRVEFNEDAFRTIFDRFTSSIVKTELRHALVVPLAGLTAEEPTDLGDGISLVRLSDDEISHCLAVGQLRTMLPAQANGVALGLKEVWGLRCHYLHLKLIGEAAISGVSSDGALAARGNRLEQLGDVVKVLRLFKSGRVWSPGYVVHSLDWPPHGQWTAFGHLGAMPLTPSREYSLTKAENSIFVELWRDYGRARKDPAIQAALRRFADAAERSRADDALVDLLIAAETLFLQNEKGDLTYKLAVRGAHYIEIEGVSRREIFDRLKRAYRARSEIVHRGTVAADEQLLESAESLMRTAITRAVREYGRGIDVLAALDALVIGE